MQPGSVLVTGANGFVGRHLCRHLAARGIRVRGSVRTAGTEGAPSGIDVRVSGEVDERTDWSGLLAGMDAVVHAAARVHVLREREPATLAAFRRTNVAGTERLLRQAAAAGIGRFVFLSSIKAAEVEREGGVRPGHTPYQISKWEAEAAVAEVARQGGIATVILRPPLVYGPGAGANFDLLRRAVARGLPLPLAGVRNRRSVLYAGNLASVIELGLLHPDAAGRVLEPADGPPVSTPDFIRAIAAAYGRPARLFPCPAALLRLAGRLAGRATSVESLIGDLVADDRALREDLGWRPPVGMADALAETVAALASRGARAPEPRIT